MVIQTNMSPKGIVDVWGETADIFKIYNVPLTNQSLDTLVDTLVESELMPSLIKDLNSVVGSSTATCIEGG